MALQKLIVTSATYTQSSVASPELRAADPDNRLLARGPRNRLPAAVIRDHALAASGLLVDTIGGPPVKPYQPEGLWREIIKGRVEYKRDSGDKLYRRSLYTLWRRAVKPPLMMLAQVLCPLKRVLRSKKKICFLGLTPLTITTTTTTPTLTPTSPLTLTTHTIRWLLMTPLLWLRTPARKKILRWSWKMPSTCSPRTFGLERSPHKANARGLASPDSASQR